MVDQEVAFHMERVAVFANRTGVAVKVSQVKVIHREVSHRPDMVERFKREAQAVARIDHPHVCRVTDFAPAAGGRLFLVMEFLEGETLADRLARVGRIEQAKMTHIAKQICGGLQAAHQLGIVHRDLKPENVMLVKRDQDPDFVKIVDFGIAKMALPEEEEGANAKRLTREGTVFGTPSYLAPEQAFGDPIDARADLYCVGAILHTLLTGAPPFGRGRLEELLPRVMRNRNKPHEPFDEEVIARLREFYKPYNEELAEYLDLDLDWNAGTG